MGGGADDEAHRATGPVLWERDSRDKEWVGIILGRWGWERGKVPLPDPAEALEIGLVELGGETRVGGDGEVVEDVADDAGLL